MPSTANQVRPDALNVLITGANRGIGLALAQRFARSGYNVIGASRSTSGAEVADLAKIAVAVVPLDVADDASVAGLPDRVRAVVPHLDIVVNNAGVNVRDNLESATPEGLAQSFRVNTVAPLLIARALLPLLRASPRRADRAASAKVVNISSIMASVAAQRGPLGKQLAGNFGYRGSKAALNMVTAQLANDVQDVSFLALHPGHVRTRMGGETGPIAPDESADNLFRRIQELKPETSGTFVGPDGKEIPW